MQNGVEDDELCEHGLLRSKRCVGQVCLVSAAAAHDRSRCDLPCCRQGAPTELLRMVLIVDEGENAVLTL